MLSKTKIKTTLKIILTYIENNFKVLIFAQQCHKLYTIHSQTNYFLYKLS